MQKEVKITRESIKTELQSYRDKPYKCLFEYFWNSFDAGASEVEINYTEPELGLGCVENVEIIDNGNGWNFDENSNTATFLSSTKSENNSKQKTLPRGRWGRGRYVFIWIADAISIYSNNKMLSLTHDAIINESDSKYDKKGTKISFQKISTVFSSDLSNKKQLKKELLLEFGWFLRENSNLKIKVNGEIVDPIENVKQSKILKIGDFSQEITKELDGDFRVEIVLWKEKPVEWSNFYFLNSDQQELFKKSTGLNKKSDDFWHSVYIVSDFFTEKDIDDEKNINQQQLDLENKNKKRAKNKLIKEIKKKLIEIRRPYLIEQSKFLIEDLKENEIMPNLPDYGIYDEESYNNLLETIYTISPSLFTGKNDSEKKFICATFAGLLSVQDSHLIQIILEQLQVLTEEEKTDLLDILNRTSLSNVVRTIKEVDHRLEVIDKLKILISDFEKETLEVKHLQKILDENFWIFGEQFRLFSSTEGSIKNVLIQYAKEILKIDNPNLDSNPSGEVDLFLTKTEDFDGTQKNIIIELKRASLELKEDTEYVQIKKYCKKILEQNLCNGDNQIWEFYLIGKSYDSGIDGLITSAQNHGEKQRGLVFWDKDGKVKIYVRKWSDILEAEWGSKMKYLKEKLKIQAKQGSYGASIEVVNDILNKE